MPVPASLDVQMALIYFHAYMYGPLVGKLRLYKDRQLSPRMAMSEDWEVFASILVRNVGAGGASGLDLESYEVKSAHDKSSFEYQYHKSSWEKKLEADSQAGHIFISHRDELRHVDVRYCDGNDLSDFFEKWRNEKPYSRPNQQRFRRSIPYRRVVEKATLICELKMENLPTSMAAHDGWPGFLINDSRSWVRRLPPIARADALISLKRPSAIHP